MQKGSVLLFVLLAIILIISLGLFFISQGLVKNDTPVSPQQVVNKEEENIYSNLNLGFEFKYPKNLTVKEDTEEEFNKRGNGDFRKNFKYYVTYPPAEVLGAVVILDETESFEMSPFTVWVFDNSNNLTIEQWYKNYWYYPFIWGDYTLRRNDVAPVDEATVSGQLAKSGIISYREGNPKFVYVAKDQKMYLFQVIGEKGEQILSTFKLLE